MEGCQKKAAFHCELAAVTTTGGAHRVGVGISRTAGVLLEAIEKVQPKNMKLLLKPELLDTALREAEPSVPHLQKLDGGKGTETEEEAASSFAALKKLDVDRRLG